MKKITLLFVLTLSVAALAASKKKADPEADTSTATLRETGDWLRNALNSYGGAPSVVRSMMTKAGGVDSDGQPTPPTMEDMVTPLEKVDAEVDDKCTFYVAIHVYDGTTNQYDDRNSALITIPLGAVTNVSVDMDRDAGITILTGQIAAIHTQPSLVAKEKWEPQNLSSFYMKLMNIPAPKQGEPMPDSPVTMAPRILKAFRHAVNLCKGTYTPAATTQAKQPF